MQVSGNTTPLLNPPPSIRPYNIAGLPGWQGAWAAPDRRSIPAWAKSNIRLPAGIYAVAGSFHVEESRYLMAPFADIQDMRVREVTVCGAIQTGKTLIADISIPWIMANDPGSIMWTFQADDDGKQHMLTRAWPLWNSIKALNHLWPMDRNKKNISEVYFGNFFLIVNGANPNSLQSKSIRWKFNSELWLPQWQDLYNQAVGRVSAFEATGQSKVVNDSQSGNVNDIMHQRVLAGHYAEWSAPCPACKEVIPLKMAMRREDKTHYGMVWDKEAKSRSGQWDVNRCVETVRWQCKCGHELPDSDKTRADWNATGVYVPRNPNAPYEIRSYWWSAIHKQKMRTLAAQKAAALNLASGYGDMSELKTFKQQRENEPWEEVHLTVEISTVATGFKYADYANGEKWEGEIARVMTIDRQHGIGKDIPHRWVEVRAFQANGDSRQIWFGRLETKEACRDLQTKMGITDRCVWQDSRFEKALVYAECAEYGWTALWSSEQNSWAHYIVRPGVEERIKYTLPYSPINIADMGNHRFARYILFNDGYMSDILHNLLSGRGVKWEHPDDVNEEYIAHLKAEHKIEKRPGVFKWEKIHSTKANHGRDCSKLAVCFAVVLKLIALPKLKEDKAA